MSIILDPFIGSGTTIRVAKRLNRNFIGIDNNPNSAVLLGLEPNTDYSNPIDSIFIGDCVEVMQKLYDIHGPFIDLCYADPPFGRNSVDKMFGINWNNFPADEELLLDMYGKGVIKLMKYETKAYLTWIQTVITLIHKLLKPTGSFYLHCDGKI
jgi:DNA modification methylase